jgi:hypothetical protein
MNIAFPAWFAICTTPTQRGIKNRLQHGISKLLQNIFCFCKENNKSAQYVSLLIQQTDANHRPKMNSPICSSLTIFGSRIRPHHARDTCIFDIDQLLFACLVRWNLITALFPSGMAKNTASDAAGAGSFSLDLDSPNDELGSVLNFIESNKLGRVVSSPTILVAAGQDAIVKRDLIARVPGPKILDADNRSVDGPPVEYSAPFKLEIKKG